MLKKSFLSLATIPLMISGNLAIDSSIPVLSKTQPTLISQSFPNPSRSGFSRRRSRLLFKVPNVTGSGNLRAGFARGSCSATENSKGSLKAVLPKTNIGLTVAENPTIFFYVSLDSSQTAKFTLMDETGSETILEKTLFLNGSHGIISVSIPQDSNLLQVGKKYQWNLQLLCNNDGDNGANPTIQGWLRREALTPSMASRFNNASPSDRLAISVEQGWWYDSLKTLADLRRDHPNDPTLATDWADLLSQDQVGLADIATEPLIEIDLSSSNSTP
jgi:hypothetical protein